MTKHIFKFFIGGAAVAFLGWLLFFGLQYAATQSDPDQQILKKFENLEKQYAEDPYGGETPEETLRLFIDALKKGDTNLAAKYFVIDEQENWREQLSKIQEKGLMNEMIKDMEGVREEKINNEIARYFIV